MSSTSPATAHMKSDKFSCLCCPYLSIASQIFNMKKQIAGSTKKGREEAGTEKMDIAPDGMSQSTNREEHFHEHKEYEESSSPQSQRSI